MKIMKYVILVFSSIVGALMLSGCDWTSGGGVNSFNNNPSNINTVVAGVYRAPDAGDPIVTDYRSQSRPGSTSEVSNTISVRGESLATGNGTLTVFAGNFSRSGIVPGSVLITGAGYSFNDNGSGALVGSPVGSGSVTYETGAWSIDFSGFAPSSGTRISGNYEFSTTSVNVDRGSSVKSGASATTIYSFTVQQVGNSITLIDNNGDRYQGKLGSAQVTQQSSTSAEQQQLQGAIQFQADGKSKGINVTIAGVFNTEQTIYYNRSINVNTNNSSASLEEFARTISLSMDGTWIEPSAKGNVRAIGPQGQRIEVNNP